MKKRPFVLLELLIAFALVALCALPLIQSPFALLRTEIRSIEKIELARKAAVEFAKIQEQLITGSVHWEDLGQERVELGKPQEFALGLKGVSERSFRMTSSFLLRDEFQGKVQEEHRFGLVEIVIEPSARPRKKDRVTYRFAVHLKKGGAQ